MIRDTKKWNIAVSMLSGFMQHVPTSISEECVQQYHQILSQLEDASGEDLSAFKIPEGKLQKEVTGFRPGGYRGGRGSVSYSKLRFCNYSYFSSQLHGVANFIPTLRESRPAQKENSYASLTDDQLRDLLQTRKLRPKRVVNQEGETHIYDRAYAIGALLKDDRAETATSISNVYNINDSNFIHSSPGASITEKIAAKNEELHELLTELRQFSAASDLSPEHRSQMNVDIGTIELHLNSSRPNPSVIKASLESVRAIAENAAGTVLGAGVIIAIKHYLGIP
jgi:hypothetical protein